jgi:hypothetical protein
VAEKEGLLPFKLIEDETRVGVGVKTELGIGIGVLELELNWICGQVWN